MLTVDFETLMVYPSRGLANDDSLLGSRSTSDRIVQDISDLPRILDIIIIVNQGIVVSSSNLRHGIRYL
jgi:hypothetical protein